MSATRFDPRLEVHAPQAGAGAEIFIYNAISEEATEKFIVQLNMLDADPVNVRINSGGGSVYQAVAIYQAMNRHASKFHVHIDGMALSAASLIAMAGDRISMARGAMIMIHSPLMLHGGNSVALRKNADLLEKLQPEMASIYANRTGQPLAAVNGWMAEETWFTADEAMAVGLIDEITEAKAVAAELDPANFCNLPADWSLAQNCRLTPNPKPQTPNQPKVTMPHEQPAAQPPAAPAPVATPATPPPIPVAEAVAQTIAPVAASVKEIRAKFPQADSEFVLAQVEASATMEAVAANYAADLQTKLDEAQANHEKELAAAKQGANGVDPLNSGVAGDDVPPVSGDPVAQWNAKVDAHAERRRIPRNEAAIEMAKENPELRNSMIAAHNAAHGRTPS